MVAAVARKRAQPCAAPGPELCRPPAWPGAAVDRPCFRVLRCCRFAIPFVVIVGWVTGHPFSLSFDPFSAVALLLAICQSNFVTSGALSHWLLGVQLIALYIIISIAYLFKE